MFNNKPFLISPQWTNHVKKFSKDVHEFPKCDFNIAFLIYLSFVNQACHWSLLLSGSHQSLEVYFENLLNQHSYRTQVRSLALVTNSLKLINRLRHSCLVDLIDMTLACWISQFNTCWNCCCWYWATCWQQFGADLEAGVLS